MSAYEKLQGELKSAPKTWLVTGVAGFIGSNLLETLLKLNQRVVGLDNLSTGKQHNLDQVKARVTAEQWASFKFLPGDICDAAMCQRVCAGVELVLHQAALGSVPRSMAAPLAAHEAVCLRVQQRGVRRLAGTAQGRGQNRQAAFAVCGDEVHE